MSRDGARRWASTAVGYFLGRKPYFHHLNEYARSSWPAVLDVTAMAYGFYFFRFKTIVVMEEVIEGGPWLFHGQPIILQQWEPGMALRRHKHTQVPVWIRLRHLPVEFWTNDGLSTVLERVWLKLDGYVGLPANPGIRARSPFSAVARRILGSACEREEGRKTVSRGGDSYTIDMDTTRTDNPIALIIYIEKRGSLPQGIRALIASKKRMNQKEQVHSSKMDHCSLPGSTKEQYVTLSIPPDYISSWKAEGYTHLHLGAVRLVLSYHGRKGLPVTARIALLDTRFLKYEHAIIGTVLTTLNCGSIVVTFFPNFVVSLCDPHVASAFKVQVQITGANQVPASVMATLHHQLVFRLQNHGLDLPNQGSRDALMVLANSRTEFKRLPDGRVKTIFETQPAGEPSNPEFQLMITPIPVPEELITPIDSFGADGHRIYTDWINGHFIWDVDPSMCDPECSCGEESDNDDDDYIWSDYESDEDDDFSSYFPPMERYVDSAQKYSSKPYVQNNVVDTEGKLKPLTQAEEVLNWQTTNARAQNRSLTTLDAKMDRVLANVQTMESKVEGMEN
ncbi:UNVERIFIED_CONTAM: polyprotein [Sesamum latifolium]|uniref:Polyprotein n=1 Tax=Sesamum latifolium TaxID=2727402 RepID=A0AAW2WUN2_9LAMI